MKTIVLSYAAICEIAIESHAARLRDQRYFFRPPGEEHYRLLAYLSTLFDQQTLIDVGTDTGNSALALAHNPANQVVSFDIANNRALVAESEISNIEFIISDCTAHPALSSAALVFLDTSPHSGAFEKQVYDRLTSSGFRGILVMDDICYPSFPGLREFWESIPLPKVDITRYGHHSGTGVVNFGATQIVLS